MVRVKIGGVTFGKNPLIKSVQEGAIIVTGGAGIVTNTATIDSVDTSNSILFFGGNETDGADITDALVRLVFTNATTITARSYVASGKVNKVRYVVLEFQPGIIKSIQRGKIILSSSEGSDSVTITSVDTSKSVCIFLGTESWQGGDYDVDQATCQIFLANATTVTASRNTGTNTYHVGYEVVEFY